jgi:hypothetical protein
MTTDISIASQALVLLGDNPLSSFTDETDAAKLVAQRYPGLRKRLISSHPWRCMMTKAELTREAAAPIGEWAYSYIIPGEALGSGAQALFSSNGIDELPAKSYEVFGRRIYTNYKRVFIDFVVEKPESEWPAWFADLMMYALMADIAFPVTDQQSTADRWAGWTYGTPSEGGKGGYWAQCTTIDAQGQPNEQVQNDAFINARAGGWGPY